MAERGKAWCSGPPVPGHRIGSYAEQHAWVIDGTLVPCSASEWCCLKVLLERADRCVRFDQFAPAIAECAGQKKRLARLVSRLRPKLWTLGLDIVSVMNVGYLLRSGAEDAPIEAGDAEREDA